MGKIPTEYSHQQLVDEMAKLSKLPMEQRMKIAKNKRLEQLKLYQSNNSSSRNNNNNNNSNNNNNNNNNRYVDNEYVPRKGSNRETKISFDKTALLFDAAAKSDIKEVRYLITTGNCDKDATNCHGMTVLHQSCVDHNLALIHILIKELRADVMKADHEMWTPLHTAALLGYADIAKFLLDNGADPLALNAELNMPYDICDDPDTLDIIELNMAGRGVTQNRIEELRNKSESAMLSDLMSEWNKFGRLSFQGENGETLLHIAACNGYSSVSNFLLGAAGQSATTADKDGWQPLHCAAYWQHLKVIENLMNYGANVYDKTLDGETVLDLCKDANICDWMIQRSADNRHNNFNQSSSSLRKSQMRRSSIDNRFDSQVSLTELNKFSSSAKRLNAEKKEKRRKKDVQNEFERLMSSQNDLDDNDGNNKNNNNNNNNNNRHGEVNSNRHSSYPKLLNNNNNSNNNIKNAPDDESLASRQGNRGSILGSNVLNFYNNHPNIDYCESPRLLSLQSANNNFSYNNTSLDANYLKSNSPSSRSRANSKNSNISVESEKKLSSLPEFGESNGKVSSSRERSQSCRDETAASSAKSSRKESKKKTSAADKLSKSKKASKNDYEDMPARARSLKNESNKFSSFENEFSKDGTDRKRSESTKRHSSSSRNNLTEAGLNPERKSLSLNQLMHDQYVGELYGKKKLTKSKFSSNNKCLIS